MIDSKAYNKHIFTSLQLNLLVLKKGTLTTQGPLGVPNGPIQSLISSDTMQCSGDLAIQFGKKHSPVGELFTQIKSLTAVLI